PSSTKKQDDKKDTKADAERVARLIKQLGDDDFAKREAAGKELNAIGTPALAALRNAASSDELEIRRRASSLVTSITEAEKEPGVKEMQERLQGDWKCVSMHSNGLKSEPDLTCTIKGNTWETKLDGKVFQSGTFKLVDLDASPKQIEWVITAAEAEEQKGKTIHGIFMLDGDSLCWNTCDAAKYSRPQALFTEQDDGCCAGMFKRADPKQER